MISKKEALHLLEDGNFRFPPFSLEIVRGDSSEGSGRQPDIIARFARNQRVYDFRVLYKAHSTPKELQEAIYQAVNEADTDPALIVTPHLSEANLRLLEQKGLSGMDLCGNGIIQTPQELFVLRTGAPNKFPNSAPIKNIYRGKTSLVARAFLAKPDYNSVNEILGEIKLRGGDLTLSTVSKALQGLEEDLLVGRASGRIRLLQPEKLLDRLVENYQRPEITRRFYGAFVGKNITDVNDALYDVLAASDCGRETRWVATGESSIHCYAAMVRRGIFFYCSNISPILSEEAPFKMKPETHFPDVVLLETKDKSVYFDRRPESARPCKGPYNFDHALYVWASPVQTYLELMGGDKRDVETAEQVKCAILKEIEEARR